MVRELHRTARCCPAPMRSVYRRALQVALRTRCAPDFVEATAAESQIAHRVAVPGKLARPNYNTIFCELIVNIHDAGTEAAAEDETDIDEVSAAASCNTGVAEVTTLRVPRAGAFM